MEAQYYIIAEQLPLTQDFKSLKEEALAFIQEHGGNEWTNLNPSDPGVTILDQVCYALTELGYCNDFSINDMLTASNGKLKIKNQFYLPEQILTSSPVTLNDYRKYLIDNVKGLKNVMIYAKCNTFYQAYLSIDEHVVQASDQDLEKEAFYCLNKCRNTSELFFMPKVYEKVNRVLIGELAIENESELTNILIELNTAIQNAIFPKADQVSYDHLKQDGYDTNEIFNGPLLQNGWITTAALGTKKDQLTIAEITNVMRSIKGISTVTGLAFKEGQDQPATREHEILHIDLSELTINYKGNSINFDLQLALNQTRPPEMHIVLGAAVNIQTTLPKGKYRDINNYYSIQNTFPELYAVGANAITANATPFQIAQSRQLKGYLTLFDQVLANQFSQLANIDQLFSFKNSINGNPSDVKEFYDVKDAYEKQHLAYPAPYLTFSPTYYYQSLYNVPHIGPLLKDNEALRIMTTAESDKEVEANAWKAYKQNPYNPYIHGLMELMEDKTVNLSRRNDLLDHLLARHGESPLVIDAVIKGTVYTGNKLNDQVILKSLYLQNFGLLSYYRQKAYNYLAANEIKGLDIEILATFNRAFFSGDTSDFIFDVQKIDRLEKLKESDFINYAALELKLALLFGLKAQFKNYLIHYYHESRNEIAWSLEIQVALWLIQHRKGFILIETKVLWQFIGFEMVVKIGQENWQIDTALNYQQLLELHDLLTQNGQTSLNTLSDQPTLKTAEVTYPLKRVAIQQDNDHLSARIKNTAYTYTVKIKGGAQIDLANDDLIFGNKLILILPSFLKSNDFTARLDLFLQQTVPVALSCSYYFKESKDLLNLIKAFVSWHNCLINEKPKQIDHNQLRTQTAIILANLLIHYHAETK
ncbi:hypothetical protein [Pedobacter sp. Hv1]|uniref:hypothetical protein n=1 Tax=Pedobacter sp. Hv1 TaxID=1740090 RepID=UPI0006D88A95|nr:hypothetical protein [Pedobacter sp. Hv1]KQC01777.1 hypothetical protein AQF98_05260 [Pedobacter sp. Hv1]